MTDEYRATAGVYDLVAEGYAGSQLSALREFFPLVDIDAGPVLDIGCGSGRHLAYLLGALPTGHMLGLEPSGAMRALALSRLAANPQWRDRVTVRPEGALTAPLPDTLGGVVMLGVFGHFTDVERRELLARLSTRLPENGAMLLDLQLPEEPTSVTPYVFADTHLGSLRYRGIAEATPLSGEAMQWRMTYQTLDGDTVLEEATAASIFAHPRHETVRQDMQMAGLRLAQLADTTYWIATRDH